MKSVELKISNFPYQLHLSTHSDEELVSKLIQQDKIWEAFETELFIKNIKQGQCVLDIGANIGYYTVIASKLVTNEGTVLAFEPEPHNFSLLKQNCLQNKCNNVKLYNLGLGESSDTLKLFINPDNRGDHRCFTDTLAQTFTQIKVAKGDDYTPEQVHFIKIDTQGFELKIIRGLNQTIRNNQRYLHMIVELWPYALQHNGNSAEELIDELAQYNFRPSIIDHIHFKLLETDWGQLKKLVLNELTPEHQGFINLFLSPEIV